MENRNNLLRNLVIVLGFVAAIIVAFLLRSHLPESAEGYSGLIFFGTILTIGCGIGALAGKIMR